MNYFVNDNIYALNSGTEFSAVKRLKLFRKNGQKARILTRNYNPQLSGDLARVGLKHEDALNLYDYFQEIVETEEKDVDVRYAEIIDKRVYHIEGIDANESNLNYHGQKIARVGIAPSTVGLIGTIEYVNGHEDTLVEDIWDRRGFKSSTIYKHPDGQNGLQIFFNQEGTPQIEVVHMAVNGQLRPTLYKLLNYKGRVHRFATEEDFFVFFMNELVAQEPSVFISDRPSLVPALCRIEGAVAKWQYLHGTHSSNSRQAGASRQVVDYLRPIFTDYKDQLDGVLVATEQQRDEIKAVFDFKNVLAVPDTYATKKEVPKPLFKRHRYRILYLGRLSADKKPVDPVTVLEQIHHQLPKAELVFVGYATPREIKDQIEKQIQELKLQESVSFKDYATMEEVHSYLQESALLINTSEGEGFGMTILEALEEGLPVVAYDVKYGVSSLIENRQNGRLVPYGAVKQAADAAVEILLDERKWQKYSEAARHKSEEFSDARAWTLWQNAQNEQPKLFNKA